MLKYDPIKLKNILIEECGYNNGDAEITIETLVHLDDIWQEILDQWLFDRSIPNEPFVEGVTIPYIMKKNNFSFFEALRYMNFFYAFPEEAKDYLNLPPFRRR